MKKSIYLFGIIYSILVVFSYTHLEAQTIDWSSINLYDSSPVKGKINGFNMGGYSYGRICEQSNNVSVPSECNECGLSLPIVSGSSYSSMQTKPSVVTETAKLKPSVLRFPGGTHSGWYHYYKYNNQGFYDASSPQVDKGYGMTLIESAHLKNPLNYCRLDSRVTTDQNYLDGFVNYVKNIQNATSDSKKIEVSYVANLLTHFRFKKSQQLFSNCGREKAIKPMGDYDCSKEFVYSYEGNEVLFDNDKKVYRFELYYKETQDVLSRLISDLDLDRDDVLYVEMGNEYYSNETYPYNKYQMDVEDYARLVETYTERLKCFFSDKVDIRIGIVTKPDKEWHIGIVNNLNLDLNNDGKTLSDGVDAVIYHHYYTESACLNEGDIKSRFDCAKNTFRNHIEQDLTTNLDILQNDFPNQKIWITEWNMLKGENNKNNSYINTILHASFVQEYALSILEYNAANSNVVSMLTHHRLGDHNVWSVIQTKDGNNNDAHFRSGAHAMQHISKLYEYGNMNYIGPLLMDKNTLFDTKEAKVTSFLQYKGGVNNRDKLLLFFTNKLDSGIGYTIPISIDGVSVQSARISLLRGNQLFTYGPRNTSVGKNQFIKSASKTYFNNALDNLGYGVIDNQFEFVMDSTIVLGASHVIPKNTIGVLEVYLDEILSLNETVKDASDINIYPNPATKSVTIAIGSEFTEVVDIQFLATDGTIVSSINNHVNTGDNIIKVDVQDLNRGMYFVVVRNNRQVISKKLVIN